MRSRPAWGRTGGKWFGIEQYGVTPGHHHQRQGPRQRIPHRTHCGETRDRRRDEGRDHIDLRRQSDGSHRRQSCSRLHRGAEPSRQRRRGWRASARIVSSSCRTSIRSSAKCAAWGSCRGSSLCRIARLRFRPRRKRRQMMEATRENRILLGKGRTVRQRAPHLAAAQHRARPMSTSSPDCSTAASRRSAPRHRCHELDGPAAHG